MPSTWPPAPGVVYSDLSAAAAQTLALNTAGVIWGGGTTKPISTRGLYVVDVFFVVRANTAGNSWLLLGLDVSANGTTYTNVDPGGTLNNYGHRFNAAGAQLSVHHRFQYNKTATGTEYLRVAYQTVNSDIIIEASANVGVAAISQGIRVSRFPTW